jgi:hypothetical protein
MPATQDPIKQCKQWNECEQRVLLTENDRTWVSNAAWWVVGKNQVLVINRACDLDSTGRVPALADAVFQPLDDGFIAVWAEGRTIEFREVPRAVRSPFVGSVRQL